MKMRDNMMDIRKVFVSDENLLRLLYYKPINYLDDPLDPLKPNILDMNESEKWEIIDDVIVPTFKISDLDTSEKCRILFYPVARRNTGNYLLSSQSLAIDILTHVSFDGVDMRLSWICDTVNNLLFKNKITGVKDMGFSGGDLIRPNPPKNYVGYQLIYFFGSIN